jgi:hypothetical protein
MLGVSTVLGVGLWEIELMTAVHEGRLGAEGRAACAVPPN